MMGCRQGLRRADRAFFGPNERTGASATTVSLSSRVISQAFFAGPMVT